MRGGGRRHGGTRPLSPNSRTKDRRLTGRHSPFVHRPRRSLSPSARTRPRQSTGRRSVSVEHRDYASRRLDHGKQPMSHTRISHGDAADYASLPNYMLPDHSTTRLIMESKPPRSFKDVDFHHPASSNMAQSSTRATGQGMLPQKSMFLDEGSTPHTYYTLPPDTGYLSGTTTLKSESIGGGISKLNSGNRDSEMLRSHLRDPYDERDREKVYTRDVSFPSIPPPDTRPFSGASSTGFMKDDLLDLYRERLDHPSDGFGKGGGFSKYIHDPLHHKGHSQVQLSDPMRWDMLSSPDRNGSRNYSYHEFGRNERVDHRYLETENTSKKIPWGHQGDFRDTFGSSFLDNAGDGFGGTEAPRSNLTESSLWNQHGYLRDDAPLDYCDMTVVNENHVGGSGNGRQYRMKSSRDHELVPFDARDTFGRDAASTVYKGRHGSPQLSDHHVDWYSQGVNPHRGSLHMDDLDLYDMPYERMTTRREYTMDENRNKSTLRNMSASDHRAFRRVQSPNYSEEILHNENKMEFPRSKKIFGHPQQRESASRISRSDAWLQTGDSSEYVEGGRGTSLKKRLRPGPSEFHGSFLSERRHEFFRPHKFWKRGFEDRHGGFNSNQDDGMKNDAPLAKTDPPEDSEEFKHQVHKAFLRFSKLLNESPHQQKRYREQGKAGNLLCCVCGSHSKEFVDTHSLVTHAYYSMKVGLRTEHLGFHKALCLLMGWNWLMAPDGKIYQSRPVSEAKELKEDLILWPPIVIVHNSSIGNNTNTTNGTRVVPVEQIEEMLREMGFGAGKTRVGRGKPANQSVFLVKFMPTFSGLQEAERLHKHYVDNNRGRPEFHQIASDQTGSNEARKAHMEKVDELLYGYMAIAEDMDKLDPETKKRSLVKSKKDIEAIADAPLNTD